MAKSTDNPPAFRATGQGYFNRVPNLAANRHNANGLFVNTGFSANSRNHHLYGFITALTTGWTVAGAYGQAVGSRTFYPKNLSQQPITIEGIVANQYEYDRLTEFFSAHHTRAVDLNKPKDADPTMAMEFHIKADRVKTGTDRKGNPTYRYISRGLPGGDNGLKVRGYVLNWQAGHQRFVNAPTWQCQMQVSYDYLENPVHIQGILNNLLVQNYIRSLGQLYKRPVTSKIALPFSHKDGGFSLNPTTTNDDDNFFSNPSQAQIDSQK